MDVTLLRQICGALAGLIGVGAYLMYIRGIFCNGEKPHLFSWFLWGVMTLIIWYVQYLHGAGPGAWMTFVTAVFCLIIAGCACLYGEKRITQSDWVALLLGFTAIPLWYFTKNPLFAVILLTVIDMIGLYPTIRKALLNPWQENLPFTAVTSVKYALGIAAIDHMTPVNWFYAGAMLVQNIVLFIGLFVLRHVRLRAK
jgi:hypothetical protein